MSKPIVLFRGPVKTRSGYGAHARDILWALREMGTYDIKIDSCGWGSTPMTALEDNEFHNWILNNIVSNLDGLPDIYIQVTIPNEFRRFGRVNIGITAGIETTVAPKDWIDGCNNVDLVITTSNFSRDVLLSTVYNENDKVTGKLVRQHRIEKPVKVLFEGVDTEIYNDTYNNKFELDIPEEFAFLFVGHWLKGDLGQDRKDVGMLIKSFIETFKDSDDKPALVLKTSSAGFSVKDREQMLDRIKTIIGNTENPPSVYLLFGELTDNEMNDLYNHPKIKAMVSLTKGEGFGRPLLEFTMSGKPVAVSNWSGHKDFLPLDKCMMIGGSLTDTHESAHDNFIIKGSKWFTANYEEFKKALVILKKDYDSFLKKSELLKTENKQKFSIEKMVEVFQSYLPTIEKVEKPVETKLILPKLNKIK